MRTYRYISYTPLHIILMTFLFWVLALAAAGIISGVFELPSNSLVVIYGLLCCLVLVQSFYRAGLTFILAQRFRKHHQGSSKPNEQWYGMAKTSLIDWYKRPDVGYDARLIEETGDWALYDVTFKTYYRTKYGRYHGKSARHTVLQATLQRKTPHLVFDNKKAHKSQFQSFFHGAQKLSFEGDFDRYYSSYSPQFYQIDTLSFITPEVLYAMREFTIAADVEFKGNQIICYAPLIPKESLDAFKAQCQKLFASVNDNLLTYRDDRLSGLERIEEVHAFGRELLMNPWRRKYYFIFWWIVLLGGTFIALRVEDGPRTNPLFWLLITLPALLELLIVVMTTRRNNKAIKSYKETVQ